MGSVEAEHKWQVRHREHTKGRLAVPPFSRELSAMVRKVLGRVRHLFDFCFKRVEITIDLALDRIDCAKLAG